MLAVDNPAQVQGALKEAFKYQAEPLLVRGDAMHGCKRVTDEIDNQHKRECIDSCTPKRYATFNPLGMSQACSAWLI